MNAPMIPSLSMYESLMAGSIKGTISHEALIHLSRWLGCKEYVLPADRSETSVGPLISYSLNACTDFLTNKADVFELYLLLDDIETSLSIESQQRILSWIQDSSCSAIAAF